MDSQSLPKQSLPTGTFRYSAVNVEDLGATEYTLVTIAVDESGSTYGFQKDMENSIKQIVESCKSSPRSDFLLLRLLAFSDNVREIHGFNELVNCKLSDYDDCLNDGGCTALFKAAKNAIDVTANYGETLFDSDFDVNAVIFIVTDGMDNRSGQITAVSVKNSLNKVIRAEKLESMLSVLIGVGIGDQSQAQQYLDEFKDKSGLSQFINIENADAKTLAKLADFVSKSISSQSNSLGSGGSSQPLTF